jgi:hypothetical protein
MITDDKLDCKVILRYWIKIENNLGTFIYI